MENNKLKAYFGFARKSQNLVSGYDTCINLIKRKKIKLILITMDASDKTKEKFQKLTEASGVQMYIWETTEYLSGLTGLADRNIYGILDENFAKAIAKEIESMRE